MDFFSSHKKLNITNIFLLCFLINFGLISSLTINNKNVTEQQQPPSLSNDTNMLPPLVFPKNQTVFKILPNNLTLSKLLQHENNKTDTEVNDLNNVTEYVKMVPISGNILPNKNNTFERIKQHRKVGVTKSQPGTSTNSDYYEDYNEPNEQTEDIQNPSSDEKSSDTELEENYNRRQALNLNSNDGSHLDEDEEPEPLNHGHIIAIVALATVVLCIGAYAALVVWRNKLENRYGARERLVNEEDLSGNHEDIREYEL